MSSRAEEKARAREERERAQRQEAAAASRAKRLRVLAVLVGIAAVAIVAVVVLGQAGTDDHPAAGGTDARSANALFAGIPQDGAWLGDPQAPVVMEEYVDMQCPFCARFSEEALPTIVRDYVRAGRVRLRLRPIAILGPDSQAAASMAAAATLQNRGWQFTELFFANQGEENSGYVDEDFLRRMAEGVEGLDADQAMTDAQGEGAQRVLTESQTAATRARINSTPSFLIGRRGEALRPLELQSLDPQAFTGPIDELLAET
jgi:protein-disulfide isomerase